MSIQRYDPEEHAGMLKYPYNPEGEGAWVKYADHAAEVARLSKPSPAVARLVEACQLYLAGSTKKPKADQRIDILLALAAVEKEIGQ